MPAYDMFEELEKVQTLSVYPNPGRSFWPEGSLCDIITEDNIIRELYSLYSQAPTQTRSDVDHILVQFIRIKAKKLFATCYMSGIQDQHLKRTMILFKKNDFNDERLPVDDVSQFADPLEWKRIQKRDFLQYQWQFAAPTFPMNKCLFEGALHDKRILPFIKASFQGGGRFGTVYKVTVHHKHFNGDPIHKVRNQDFQCLRHILCLNSFAPPCPSHLLLDSCDFAFLSFSFRISFHPAPYLPNIPLVPDYLCSLTILQIRADTLQVHDQVAIKEVLLTGNQYESLNPGQDASDGREGGALLHVLSLKKKKPHLVKHIIDVKAIFDQGLKRYYMFPWADGGHLWEFWEGRPITQYPRDGKFIQDIVNQLLGMATALGVLHKLKYRHGDMKPENILVFEYPNQPDTWKITDLGLAKFHKDSTQKRGPTSTRHGTFSYEPPEFIESLEDDKPISRLYDIWSMGCIILQLITWLLYDIDGVKELTRKTSNRHKIESTFWSQTPTPEGWSNADVHDEVKSHMDKIMIDATGSQAIVDLLKIVKDKLLVVQRPSDVNKAWEPGYRANAQGLVDALEEIVRKGKPRKGKLNKQYWSSNKTLFRRPENPRSSGTGSFDPGHSDVSSFNLAFLPKKHTYEPILASFFLFVSPRPPLFHRLLFLSLVLAAPSDISHGRTSKRLAMRWTKLHLFLRIPVTVPSKLVNFVDYSLLTEPKYVRS